MEVKPCARCREAPRAPRRSYCNPCNALNVREWYAGKGDLRRERADRQRHALRSEALAQYGGSCACCGEECPEFLAIDHINRDGAEHRRAMPRGGQAVTLDLKRRGWPDGYRVMCHNCNWATSRGDKCPHRRAVA